MVKQDRCEFWSAIAAGIGGLFGLGGSAAQSYQNNKMQREAMAHQTSEREASQQWQDQQRIASQQYQTSEREAQNQFSESMYTKYQSPQAMVQQYEEAGLNPRLAASGTAAPGASSGSSGGAPSASAPQGTTVAPPYQNISSWAQGFGDIAQAMKSLAEAKKAGVETTRMEKFMDAEFKGITLSNISQELANQLAGVDLNVKQQTALKQAFAVLNDTNASWQKKVAEIDNLEHVKLLNKQIAETYKEKFKNEQENVKASTDLLKSQKDNTDADTAFKKAQTYLTNLIGETEKTKPALNRALTAVHRSTERMNNIANSIRSATKKDEIDKLKKQYKAEWSSAYSEFIDNIPKIQSFESDSYDIIGTILQAFGDLKSYW